MVATPVQNNIPQAAPAPVQAATPQPSALPQVGQTISSSQFNQLNTAANPIDALPAVGETISKDQFEALKPASSNPIEAGTKAFTGLVDDSVKGLSDTWVSNWDDAVKNLKGSNPDGSRKTTDQFITGGAHVAGDLGSALLAPLGAVVNILTGGQVSHAINATGNAVGNSKLAPALNKINDLFDKYPDAKQIILQDIPNILQAASLGLGGGEVAPEMKASLETKVPADVIPKAPEQVTLPSGATTDAATAESLGKVADEWRSPTEQNTAGFKIPTRILDKSPDVPSFLAEQGANPFEHIDENGKYDTLDTAQNLRETAGGASNDSMRQALRVADYSTPKTPVDTLMDDAQTYTKNSLNVTPDDIEAIGNNLKQKVEALDRKYPEGMSLEQMHDERISYGKNGKYSPVGDKSVTNDARANRAMADSLSNMIETKAPKEIGYKGFNKYISNFYKAAEYLESLNGKKAPVSFKTKLIRLTAKMGMAKLFESLPGGSLIDSVIGYQVGKYLEGAIEKMTNGQRNAFLKDLKVSDPAAYTKVTDFLKRQAESQAGRKALPAPKEKGTAENPHIMKGETVDDIKSNKRESSASMIARKYTYNPVDKKYYLKGERGGNEPKPGTPNPNDKAFDD